MLEGVLLYSVGFSTLLEEDALFSVQGGMTDWKLCLGWALVATENNCGVSRESIQLCHIYVKRKTRQLY